jgi:hypothetical protein
MTDNFRCGVVVPVCPGRKDNVELMLHYLFAPDALKRPEVAVLVLDGPDVEIPEVPEHVGSQVGIVQTEQRHEPGREQPRNVGVRVLQQRHPELNYVWFLDADILVGGATMAHLELAYVRAQMQNVEPILVGPYEWLSEGMRAPMPEVRTDFREAMFNELNLQITVSQLGVALGNFGGNLAWPISEFVRIGGFHPQLYMGRCEDGELGLRAASHRIPMMLVKEARGYHMAHAVDHQEAMRRNERDVPLLNSWHPWVQVKCTNCDAVWQGGRDTCANCGGTETKGGLIVTDQDGARFDYVCACGHQVNTLEMWAHMENCDASSYDGERVEDLILPDGL